MAKKLFDDVSDMLKIHGLTYKWLLERLAEMGYSVDKVSISKWVHGEQIADRAKEVHTACLKIMNEYQKKFAEKVKDL